MTHAVTVEFAGIPGAGKTSIAQAARAALDARGYSCRKRVALAPTGTRPARAARALLYSARHPVLAAANARYACSLRPPKPACIRGMWNQTRRLLSVAKDRYDFVILDEGLVHRAWSVTAGADEPRPDVTEALFARVYRALDAHVAFVFVDLDVETAASRISQRSGTDGRYDRMSEPEAAAAIGTLHQRARSIFACALSATGAPHLELRGESSLEANASAVADFAEAVRERTPDLR